MVIIDNSVQFTKVLATAKRVIYRQRLKVKKQKYLRLKIIINKLYNKKKLYVYMKISVFNTILTFECV
jgi:hypothetical protein